jgi:hypothetical protein
MTEILRREKVYDAEAVSREVKEQEEQQQQRQLPPSLRGMDPSFDPRLTPEAAAAGTAAVASQQQPLSRGFAASAVP